MLLLETNKLKNYILENVDQIHVVSVFLGISEEEVRYCLKKRSNKTRNPLRTDNDPSLGMMWKKDNDTGKFKIRLKDFADIDYNGDIFDLVSWTTPLKPSNPKEFIQICSRIINCGKQQQDKITPIDKHPTKIVVTKKNSTIKIQPRAWNGYDARVWKTWGLDINDLIQERVHMIDYAWINSDTFNYQYNPKDPCYAYELGKDPICNNMLYQLYFPLRSKKMKKHSKFITNNPYSLMDFSTFRKANVLILVKSKKDKMVIKKLLTLLITTYSHYFSKEMSEFVLNTTFDLKTVSSEVPSITETQARILQKNYSFIFIYTDFDRAGVQTAARYKREYGFHPLFLTNGKYGTEIDFGAKDISDIRANFGLDSSLTTLITAIEYIKDIIESSDIILNNLQTTTNNEVIL